MSISVSLNEEQSQRLEELARQLNIDPQELARSAIDKLIARSSEDFERTVDEVLEKNRELYRRLA